MEEWVRVKNERDRKVLVWLRGQVSDDAIATAARACAPGGSKPYLSAVCRQLGLKAPITPSKSPTSRSTWRQCTKSSADVQTVSGPNAEFDPTSGHFWR